MAEPPSTSGGTYGSGNEQPHWTVTALGDLLGKYEGTFLQRGGVIPREKLLAFFDLSSKAFGLAAVKEELKWNKQNDEYADLAPSISELQERILESLGVQGEFGIDFLSKVQDSYGGDEELMKTFFRFVCKEELLMDEMDLKPDVFARKKALIEETWAEQDAMEERTKTMSAEEKQEAIADMQAKQSQRMAQLMMEEDPLMAAGLEAQLNSYCPVAQPMDSVPEDD